MKSLKYSNRIIKKTILIYITIGFSIVFVTAFWMLATYCQARAEYLEKELFKRQSSVQAIDADLESVYKNLQRFAESEEAEDMAMVGDETGNGMHQARKLMESIRMWKQPFTPLHDVFIYIKQSGYIYTSSGRYKAEDFYGSYFLSESMKQEEFMQMISGEQTPYYYPAQSIKLLNVDVQAVPFAYASREYGKSPKVVVIGLLDVERLTVRSDAAADTGEIWTGVLDSDTKLLTGNLNEKNIESVQPVKQNSIVTYRAGLKKYTMLINISQYNKWKYVAVYRNELIFRSLSGYTMTAIIAFLCMLMLIVGAALIINKINIRPMAKVFSHAQKLKNTKNDDLNYGDVDRVIGQAIEDNKRMAEELQRYMKNIRISFLKDLLAGNAGTEEQIAHRADELNLHLDGHGFAVILVWVKNIKHAESHSEYMSDSFLLTEIMNNTKMEQQGYYFEYDKNMVAVIAQQKNSKPISYMDFLEPFSKYLDRYFVNWKIATGRMYDKKSEIFYSFVDAGAVIHFMNITNHNSIMTYSEDINQMCSFFYPSEIEQRLIHTVIACEKNSITQVLAHIYKENEAKGMTVLSFKYFKQALIGTLIRIINENLKTEDSAGENLLKMLDEVEETENLRDFCNRVHEFALDLSEIFECDKPHKADKYNDEFKTYIDEHYSDYTLTRKSMADYFNISESYFSRKFLKIFGKSFSDYLEEKRINEAIKMIRKTDLALNEIAVQVGYSNAQVMRRAFIRKLGEPPSKYR